MTIKVQCIGEPAANAQSFVVPSFLTLQQLLDQHISSNPTLSRIYCGDGHSRFSHFQQDSIENKQNDSSQPLTKLRMEVPIETLALKHDQVVWLAYYNSASSNQPQVRLFQILIATVVWWIVCVEEIGDVHLCFAFHRHVLTFIHQIISHNITHCVVQSAWNLSNLYPQPSMPKRMKRNPI